MINQPKNDKDILLIDDDRALVEKLRMLFEARGYEVRTAKSGHTALKQATSDLDVILLDQVLPDMGGMEMCSILKGQPSTQHVPIIILGSKEESCSRDVVQGLQLGADDFINKPVHFEELYARVESVIRKRSIFQSREFYTTADRNILNELNEIIDQELLVPFFQPIYCTGSFHLYGVEALARPKSKKKLTNPELLFKAALHYGMYQELERLSWKKAVEYASKYLDDEKLFLNCNPYLIEGGNFHEMTALFVNYSVDPKNVVLELTERSAISKSNIFYQQLARYRDWGFNFAIDDLGGGYASLESILKTKPEVIKLARPIIRNIESDPYRRSMVKFVVSFCKEKRIFSVAEGIETKNELEIVTELGVDGVQGFLLCKPTPQLDWSDMLSKVKGM